MRTSTISVLVSSNGLQLHKVFIVGDIRVALSMHFHMAEQKPYLLALPKVDLSNCACSFCVCIYQIGELTARDLELFRRHLIMHHGLTQDPPA